MELTDWVDWEPETKTDIKTKIENDGYTFRTMTRETTASSMSSLQWTSNETV